MQCWFCSVAQSCLTLRDPIDCSTSVPVLHYLPDSVQTYVHWANGVIQPSHPLLPLSPHSLCSFWVQPQKWQNDLSSFPRQTIQHYSNPSLCPNHWYWRSWSWPVPWRLIRPCRTNTKNSLLFIIGDWNAKVGRQKIPGVTGKFGLGTQNEAGQMLTEFCQKNALIIANTLFEQHKTWLYTWT